MVPNQEEEKKKDGRQRDWRRFGARTIHLTGSEEKKAQERISGNKESPGVRYERSTRTSSRLSSSENALKALQPPKGVLKKGGEKETQ